MSSISDQQPPTIYIIYNAKSTLLGKLNYAYRKTTCPNPSTHPACAACELTHGVSLSLSESAEWKETRARISNANILQLHLDERPEALFRWMNQQQQQDSVASPVVIIESSSNNNNSLDSVDGGQPFKVLLTNEDLARVRNDHKEFLQLLQSRLAGAGFHDVKVDLP